MTTVVVVRKNQQIAIAAESLVTFGDTRLTGGSYEKNNKILQVGNSYIGLSGSVAHFPVVHSALLSMDTKQASGSSDADSLPGCKLNSREEVFKTFVRLHSILKESYFLNPKEDEDDPYESSQFTALIANSTGIYGVYSYREVFCFDRFWGIGSGRSFALGAMYALYENEQMSAAQIAEAGVRAGCEFDKNSGGLIQVHTFAHQVQP